jgi:nitrogen fixation protein NifU and related proteins
MNTLIKHYKHPCHKGVIEDPDLVQEVVNRKCGDKLSFTAKLDSGIIADINFHGEGCFYCLVSASVACQSVHGRPKDEVYREILNFRSWLRDETGTEPENPEVSALGEIKSYPMRIDCVDLAWMGLQEMLS